MTAPKSLACVFDAHGVCRLAGAGWLVGWEGWLISVVALESFKQEEFFHPLELCVHLSEDGLGVL